MASKGGPGDGDPLLDRELTPGEVSDNLRRHLRHIRRRVARAYEEEAQALEGTDPAGHAARLEARPMDPTKLQVKHVVEYAEHTENAMERMLQDMTALRAQLAQAHVDQAARDQQLADANTERDQLQVAYDALRQQPAGPVNGAAAAQGAGGQPGNNDALGQGGPAPPGNGNQQQHQHDNVGQHVAGHNVPQPPVGNQGNPDNPAHAGNANLPAPPDVNALAQDLVRLRTEMQTRINAEVQRQVTQVLPPPPPQIPPGCHAPRTREWTPAEYLTLLGERTADAEMGYNGVAGQAIVPRIDLPPHDSTCPGPLQEYGQYYREVPSVELQGRDRVTLMNSVYGGETSAHQRRIAICYDSRDYKTWVTFYNEFKTLAGREGWTELQRLNQLRSRLSGNTAATANQVEFVCGRMTSERDLVAVIRFHVLGETCVSDSRTQLDTRTRQPGESIRDYGFALLELAELAYPGPGNRHVLFACERFAATVSANVHVQRTLHRYNSGNPNPSMETLASMATKAERSEELLALQMSSAEGASKTTSEAPGKTVAFPVIEGNRQSTSGIHRDPVAKVNVFKRRSRSRDRSRSGSRPRSKKNDYDKHKSRSRSGSRHHSREKSRSSSRDRQKTSGAKDTDICYRCGGRGHYAIDCPSPDSVRQEKPRSGSRDRSQSQKHKKPHKSDKKAHFPKKKKNDAFKDVIDSVLAYQQATSDVEDQEAQ